MNFLAHFIIATRFLTPKEPIPAYVLGTALPDLLPQAAERVRFRSEQLFAETAFEVALAAGVSAHLATDAAFHKAAAFAEAQAEIGQIVADAGFESIRVRRFFVAHVLTEMALDAALLRADLAIAGDFYAAFVAADFNLAAQWAEKVTRKALPRLPETLARFARSQYLRQYTDNDGVATGLSNLCRRARQDTFEGENFTRLIGVVHQVSHQIPQFIPALFSETVAGITAHDGENAFISKQE